MYSNKKKKVYPSDFTDTLFRVFENEMNKKFPKKNSEKESSKKPLTNEDLSCKIGISSKTYYRWKHGDIAITDSIIQKLACSLEISDMELKVLTQQQMNIDKADNENTVSTLTFKLAKLSTTMNQSLCKMQDILNDSDEKLRTAHNSNINSMVINRLENKKDIDEYLDEISFPYYYFKELCSHNTAFFDLILLLNWSFHEFEDESNEKRAMNEILKKYIKKATIPLSFNDKKIQSLFDLLQLRNYYYSEGPKTKFEDYKLILVRTSHKNETIYFAKRGPDKGKYIYSSKKDEINYSLLDFICYFEEYLPEDHIFAFDFLLHFALLSPKKQQELLSELFSFCSGKIGSESTDSSDESTTKN